MANIVFCTVISLEERKLVNNINKTTCSSNIENAFARIGELICFQTKELGKCVWTKKRHNSVNVEKLGTHELTLRSWCGAAWRTTWGTLQTESQRWMGAWTRKLPGPFLTILMLSESSLETSAYVAITSSPLFYQPLRDQEPTCNSSLQKSRVPVIFLQGLKSYNLHYMPTPCLRFCSHLPKKDVHTEN